MSTEQQGDVRYPYTYACDHIRSLCGYNATGTRIGRSQASQIINRVAEIIGIQPKELAAKLADYYLENRESIYDISFKEAKAALRWDRW